MVDFSHVISGQYNGHAIKKIEKDGVTLWEVGGPGPTPGNYIDLSDATIDDTTVVLGTPIAIATNKRYVGLSYKYKITKGSQDESIFDGCGASVDSDFTEQIGSTGIGVSDPCYLSNPVVDGAWHTVTSGNDLYICGVYKQINIAQITPNFGSLPGPQTVTVDNGVIKYTDGDWSIELKEFEYELRDTTWLSADLDGEDMTVDSTTSATYHYFTSNVDCPAVTKRLALIDWTYSAESGYTYGTNAIYASAKKSDNSYTTQQIGDSSYKGKLRTAIAVATVGKYGICLKQKGLFKKGSTQVTTSATQDSTNKLKFNIYDTQNSANAGSITFSSLKYYWIAA